MDTEPDRRGKATSCGLFGRNGKSQIKCNLNEDFIKTNKFWRTAVMWFWDQVLVGIQTI